MIKNVHIENYKCFDEADIALKPLTIVTGLNSTGKSTLIQSILLPEMEGRNYRIGGISTHYAAIKCKYSKKDSIIIRVDYEEGTKEAKFAQNNEEPLFPLNNAGCKTTYGKGLYYLAANRNIGDTCHLLPLVNGEADLSDGLNVFNIFELEKNNPVIPELRRYVESDTLQAQLNYWLSFVTQQQIEFQTEKVTEQLLVLKYKSDGIPNIAPSNIGTGVTFLAEVLVTCLRAHKGDVILLENPEIHLHPSAQAKLGAFLVFIAHAGIQVIAETHCEHLIDWVQYAVYDHEIDPTDVTILYKSSIVDPFQVIPIQVGGKFGVAFPEGFFDATLKELITMS